MAGSAPAQMQNTSKASEDEQWETDRNIIKWYKLEIPQKISTNTNYTRYNWFTNLA